MKFLIYINLIVILLIGCDDPKKKVFKKTDSIDVNITPDQIAYNVEVAFVDSSFTKAILNADRGRIFNSKFETLLDGGLEVQFLSEYSGKRVSLLTADSAKIDDRTKNMLATGNVIVISDSSRTKLETSLLEWNNSTRKLYSTAYVKITTPMEIIEGYGFESDPNLTHYKILKVSGVQQPR